MRRRARGGSALRGFRVRGRGGVRGTHLGDDAVLDEEGEEAKEGPVPVLGAPVDLRGRGRRVPARGRAYHGKWAAHLDVEDRREVEVQRLEAENLEGALEDQEDALAELNRSQDRLRQERERLERLEAARLKQHNHLDMKR